MNYQDPELIALLSAEYVLGTLRGPARQRFKKLLLTRPDIRDQVLEWEEYFAALNTRVEPSAVSDRVWQRVNQRLFEPEPAANKRQPFWKQWALIATTASVLLAGVLVLNTQRITTQPDQNFVSVFQDQQQQAVWSVSIRSDQYVAVTPINVPELATDKDYELWLLPNGGQPISLGLLSETEQQKLAVEELDFSGGVSLAVSLEPKGGSPTGQPTGDILYVAKVLPAG